MKDAKSERDITQWFDAHGERYAVLVAERGGDVAGWASLNPYAHRCAYRGVAGLSVYIRRAARGTGAGSMLLHGRFGRHVCGRPGTAISAAFSVSTPA